MRPFDGRRVLLGITGGIASYKSVMLARLLTQAGAEVDVVMTRSAQEFVGAITFEAVTGRRSFSEIFGAGNSLDHIRLAREASLFVVAPATADFLARAACGLADDLLTACLLANVSPVLLVPAMNDRMWANAQTRLNVAHLRELGIAILDPDDGPLAAGEGAGPGRMPEPETIFAEIARKLEPPGKLVGRKVLVTAGATREPVDPVRFISNHSSGRMGIAVADAAWRRGAEVTLVAGHVDVTAGPWLRVVNVETTSDMRRTIADLLPAADVLIMAAAPADFRPSSPASQKVKKGASPDAGSIQLAHTEDIIKSTMGSRSAGSVIVGFALETENAVANGATKLREKNLDLIVVNSAVEEGAGFVSETNRVTFLAPGRPDEELPLMKKTELADLILDRVETILGR
ncbi:MAG: bifunctional phosphopantothenoylcysteine decarboxylase/phosphopantothenate--cysteine ligase CoaBC [Gemmatimonadaceae bacterium]